MSPVKLLIVGAGCRGTEYAEYALTHPDRAIVVGVAEPREFYRKRLAEKHRIPEDRVFQDWRALAECGKCADAVIIATPDQEHVEPALLFSELGYHMLLEKPMAVTAGDCRRIVDAAVENDIVFSVCHVLRYTRYTQTLKWMLDSGAVGDIVSVQHLEPVGYWHHAHSYVRGNWRNEQESTFMLLAKSCHDLDWLSYIIGNRCRHVSSFGALKHFRPENRPQNAGDRCTQCAVETECPYSALKIYMGRVKKGETGWPVDIITPIVTEESVLDALENGPYGRCVYACDNNVVDHQVVNLMFEEDVSAAFTMTAYTEAESRKTHIFGTRGHIYGDGSLIRHRDFLTDEVTEINTSASDATILGGHGGGDYELMVNFIAAVQAKDKDMVLTGPGESLESHLMVFAAEKARIENRIVAMDEYHSWEKRD